MRQKRNFCIKKWSFNYKKYTKYGKINFRDGDIYV